MDEFASRQFPIREDMRFQQRSWLVERAGWSALVLIALVGLSGLLGTGPLAWEKASAGSLSLEYDRFQRATRVARYTFDVKPQAGPELKLHLSGAFQRDFEISKIQPEASRTAVGPDGMDLIFPAGNGEAARVVIWAHSRKYGKSDISVQAGSEPPLPFWVFVYP